MKEVKQSKSETGRKSTFEIESYVVELCLNFFLKVSKKKNVQKET